jgi:hypothetical protein
MNKDTLLQVGTWAKSRVASGEEPPWTYHKLQQLADLAFDIAEGMDSTFAFDPTKPPADTPVQGPVEVSENVVSLATFRSPDGPIEVQLPS